MQPSSHKKFRRHRTSSMAASKQKTSKEKRCRKNIATFLDLLGFQDVNPAVTTRYLLQRLPKIKEKQSRFRKITFKFNRKVPVIIQDDPTTVLETPHSDEGYGCRNSTRVIITETDSTRVLPELENPNFDDQMLTNEDHGVIEKEVVDPGSDFIRKSGDSSESTMLMVEKRLTRTDVNSKQGRLLMPILQDKLRAFLRASEKARLDGEEDMEVTVFDPKLRKLTMNLRLWKMKQQYLVLKTGWNQVVAANRLKENTILQVWSFRVDEELCFALLRVDDDDGRDV